jgi:EF-hand domain-containing protein 1
MQAFHLSKLVPLQVLRFWCVWDDRQSMYGDRRPYVLHYFLEDDTVEILEINENNSGRDPFPVFLRRCAMPRVLPRNTGTTVGTKARKAECYRPEDLRIGTYISVLNRDFLLHDADRFTKAWYADNLGYTAEEMTAVELREPVTPLPRPALPPYNGCAGEVAVKCVCERQENADAPITADSCKRRWVTREGGGWVGEWLVISNVGQ